MSVPKATVAHGAMHAAIARGRASDAQLVACSCGQCFPELARRFEGMIRAESRSWKVAGLTSDDLAQEALTVLYALRESYSPGPASLATFFRRALRWRMSHLRRAARDAPLSLDIATGDDDDASTLGDMLADGRADTYRAVAGRESMRELAAMPPAEREAYRAEALPDIAQLRQLECCERADVATHVERRCDWCRGPMPASRRPHAAFCSDACARAEAKIIYTERRRARRMAAR